MPLHSSSIGLRTWIDGVQSTSRRWRWLPVATAVHIFSSSNMDGRMVGKLKRDAHGGPPSHTGFRSSLKRLPEAFSENSVAPLSPSLCPQAADPLRCSWEMLQRKSPPRRTKLLRTRVLPAPLKSLPAQETLRAGPVRWGPESSLQRGTRNSGSSSSTIQWALIFLIHVANIYAHLYFNIVLKG